MGRKERVGSEKMASTLAASGKIASASCVTALFSVQRRRVGVSALAAPLVLGIGMAAVSITFFLVSNDEVVGRTASQVLQLFYALAVGLCAAAALTGDKLIELQQATWWGFRAVQVMRFLEVVAGAFVGAVAFQLLTLLSEALLACSSSAYTIGPFPSLVDLDASVFMAGITSMTCFATTVALIALAVSRTMTVQGVFAMVPASWLVLFMWRLNVDDLFLGTVLPLAVSCVLALLAWSRYDATPSSRRKRDDNSSLGMMSGRGERI